MENNLAIQESARPPDYLIEAIARHAKVLMEIPPRNNREANAQRLLRKEIKRLVTYKTRKENE